MIVWQNNTTPYTTGICVCIYIYILYILCIYVYNVYIHIYIYRYCLYTYTYPYIHISMYLYDMYIYIYIYICMHMYMNDSPCQCGLQAFTSSSDWLHIQADIQLIFDISTWNLYSIPKWIKSGQKMFKACLTCWTFRFFWVKDGKTSVCLLLEAGLFFANSYCVMYHHISSSIIIYHDIPYPLGI